MERIFGLMAEGFDLPILDWIAENLYCGFLDAVMPIVTVLGDAGLFWIAIAVALLFFPKYRKIGLSMGAAMVLGVLVCNVTMKPLFSRIRPYDYQLEHFGRTIQLLIATPHDFSFPSGHTLASFEAATVLLIHNKKMGVPAMVLAVLIAFSRMYLYVHYPTDVLFSVFMGIGFAFLGTWLVKKGFAAWEMRKAK
jgi:undecaprenyl-diphosphatase